MDVKDQLSSLYTDWILGFMVVNFDLEYGQKMEHMFPEIPLGETDLTNICFHAFPETTVEQDKDIIYTFRLKRSTHEKENKFVFGHVLFRQQKDASISRGYLQKSLLVLSYFPYGDLFRKLIAIVAPLFFTNGNPLLEVAYQNITLWPPPPGLFTNNLPKVMDLPILGNILQFSPVKQDGTIAQAGTDALALVDDYSLYTVFSGILDKLWVLWELILLGEPIVVMTNSPDVCSSAVLNLISLVRPLHYMGDFRPYFTIHDPEFHKFSEMFKNISYGTPGQPSPCKGQGIVLGVTNPLFRREFESWPHILLISEEAQKMVTIIHSRKERTYTKAADKTQFIGQYKPLYHVDTSAITSKLVKAGKEDLVKCVDTVTPRLIIQLTEQFMRPLELYFKHLVPSKRSLSAWKKAPSVQPFKEADFLQSLLKQGKKTKEVDFYRKFIRTSNFVNWFKCRKRNATLDISNHYLSILDPSKVTSLVKDKSEIEIVDFYLRVQVHHKMVGQTLSEALQSRVEEYKKEILLHLPPDLRRGLLDSSDYNISPKATTTNNPEAKNNTPASDARTPNYDAKTPDEPTPTTTTTTTITQNTNEEK